MIVLACLVLFSVTPARASVLSNFDQPESVAVDPATGAAYVSNIAGSPTEKDGNGYISKNSPDGNTVIQKFIGGKEDELLLNAPKGLVVVGENILVTDIDAVKGFNKENGKPSVLVDLSGLGAKFLNDLATDSRGNLYVSDTYTRQVFRIDAGKNYEVTRYKASQGLDGVNGLLVNPKSKNLMGVTFVSGQIFEIDRGGKVHVLKRGLAGLDGLDVDSEGNLYVSSFEKGEIYKVALYGRGALSTVLSGLVTPADIAYDRREKRLLIPSMKGNTVTAVSLDQIT